MSSLNKVTLIGNLGQDPEVRSMQSGDKIVNMSIATAETWKDKTTGEKKERTQWHRIVIFNQGLASIAERYLKKGSKVYIEGQLETRKWTDKDGQDKYSTEVVLRPFNGEIIMLSGKSVNGPPPASSADDYGTTKSKDQPAGGDFDDEIPF